MPLLRLITLLAAVALASALVVGLVTGTALGGEDEEPAEAATPANQGALRLVTRPDLHPPSLSATLRSAVATPGYYFVTQGSRKYGDTGPLIVDAEGRPVWVGPSRDGVQATTLEAQTYRGRPVLTWWEGTIDKDVGMGIGRVVIVDQRYRTVATVEAGNDRPTDLHEFVITPRDTALLVVYEPRAADLREYGGRASGRVLDNYVQEVDIETGEVLFEWSAFDHVPPDESYQDAPKEGSPWDAYHLNSIALDDDGDLLVSARHTWAVYKIDRETGDVLWRLGGKRSDYELGPGALFAWQHDARARPDGTLSLFDNKAASPELVDGDHSRGLILQLDEQAGTATLVREFTHPAKLLAPSQGNLQTLPDGHVLVGWGSQPHLSEYDAQGRLVADLRFFETAQSYRAFLDDWTGMPEEPPAAVALAEDGGAEIHVSWNGATEVVSWRVLGATSEGAAPAELTTAPTSSFETSIPVDSPGPWLTVEALDAGGRVLGTSPPVRLTMPSPSPSPATSPSSSP
ncbi:MAG: ArsR family transcriptional regulator [Actinobacteria bacterium]|nr:ArsR family transcriptional regulator [Actinomycetota bacterium]